ncbi:uncharacterized protein [Eurosta solidaginis]|uniref:uncharacterized protein isoform X2 n=1 Tax=Eurosta solidaginis TaxID=178769 RepID=UPI0035314DB9
MIFKFIYSLLLLASNLQLNLSAIVSNSTIPEVSTNFSTLPNDCVNTLKLEHFNQVLNQIDGAVQNLEEKAHNWAIFRHHIDAWNEQMKSLEHKLNIVKRTQDEQQAYGNKLVSLEFTLNHILSKVVYLSDTCNNQQANAIAAATASGSIRSSSASSIFNDHTNNNGNDNGRGITQQEHQLQQQQNTNELLYEHIALLGDLKQSIGVDKQLRTELSTRLNNILRHVQNIERDHCRADQRRYPNSNGNNKMAKLMTPIGSNCNSNQNIERALKSLDHKVSTLSARTSIPKDLKQMPSLASKNSQQLDAILNWIKKIDKRFVEWRDESDRDWNQCQTMSGELSTFTESSDLLLKRIEMLINDVNEKLAKRPFIQADAKRSNTKQPIIDEDDVEEVDRNHHQTDNETDTDTSDDSGIDDNLDPPGGVNAEVEASKIDDRFDIVDFLQPEKHSCHELNGPSVDGVYKFSTTEINEASRDFNERYCAFATDGASWTVIQNRGPYSEHENFNRSWVEYKNGFGELTKEFWFGNEFIHQLVDREDYELRIELTDFDNEQVWAEYSFFRLDSEQYNYNLLIGGYNGTAPDAMHYHNEMDFSTFDRRNDRSVDACCSCATGYGSGWWFDNCSEANLNGIYRETPNGHNYIGIIWEQWRGDYSLLKTRMLIRPKNWLNIHENSKEHHDHSEDP